MKVLVVKSPFAGRERSDVINDPQVIVEILASEQAHNVIVSEHEDQAAPVEDAAPEKPKKPSK